jgi:hypothetical protein
VKKRGQTGFRFVGRLCTLTHSSESAARQKTSVVCGCQATVLLRSTGCCAPFAVIVMMISIASLLDSRPDPGVIADDEDCCCCVEADSVVVVVVVVVVGPESLLVIEWADEGG